MMAAEMTPMQEDAAAMFEHGRHLMTGREMDVCEAVMEGRHIDHGDDDEAEPLDETAEEFLSPVFDREVFQSLRIQYTVELPKWKEAMR